MNPDSFILECDAVMRPYTADVAAYCAPFSCEDSDLDEFFSKDAFLYETELLGKTYAWITIADPSNILGLVTLANDSVKAQFIAGSARNRLQRSITNAKRGMNYPAVLIGRLGVSSEYRGKGLNIGSQILDFLKGWFRSFDNKTGCRLLLLTLTTTKRLCIFMKRTGSNLCIKPCKRNAPFWN